jgi:hypothetical protein
MRERESAWCRSCKGTWIQERKSSPEEMIIRHACPRWQGTLGQGVDWMERGQPFQQLIYTVVFPLACCVSNFPCQPLIAYLLKILSPGPHFNSSLLKNCFLTCGARDCVFSCFDPWKKNKINFNIFYFKLIFF